MAHSCHQLARCVGIGCHVDGSPDSSQDSQERGRGELHQPRDFGPMPGQPALQLVHQAQVLHLMQVHGGHRRLQLTLTVGLVLPNRRSPVDMELGDDG